MESSKQSIPFYLLQYLQYDAADPPTKHSTASATKNCPVQDVDGDKVGNPWSTAERQEKDKFQLFGATALLYHFTGLIR